MSQLPRCLQFPTVPTATKWNHSETPKHRSTKVRIENVENHKRVQNLLFCFQDVLKNGGSPSPGFTQMVMTWMIGATPMTWDCDHLRSWGYRHLWCNCRVWSCRRFFCGVHWTWFGFSSWRSEGLGHWPNARPRIFNWIYPLVTLVMTNMAMENDPFIDGLP